MTTNQSATAFVLSGNFTDIILEKFIAKEMSPDLDYLMKATACTKRQVKLLEQYENKLFTVKQNVIQIVTDKKVLYKKAKEYILHIIKKNVNTTKYPEHTFENDIGKLFLNKCYNAFELDFIKEIWEAFRKVSDKKLDTIELELIPDKFVLTYNLIKHYHLRFAARKIYNGILQGSLHAGDNIGEIIKEFWSVDSAKLMDLLNYGQYYDWFLEIDADKNIILRCDLQTNKNLFIKNFINTIIYNLNDNAVKVKLLRQLHKGYGFVRKDKILRQEDFAKNKAC